MNRRMFKRKRNSSVDKSSHTSQVVVKRENKDKDFKLQKIIDDLKYNKRKNGIIKLIREYVQNDNRIEIKPLQILTLRFLRELKYSLDNVMKNPQHITMINNIRLITQTMQELGIDKTMIITKHDGTIFNVLMKDEYNTYIMKNRTNNGIEIEFSAFIITLIANKKMLEIQSNFGYDIFEESSPSSSKSSKNSSSKSSPKSKI